MSDSDWKQLRADLRDETHRWLKSLGTARPMNDAHPIDPGFRAQLQSFVDGGGGPDRDGFFQRHHHVGRFDVSKIDDVMDHGALRCSERAFAFALHGDLFQFFARDEETR